jgi:hypothetical protein
MTHYCENEDDDWAETACHTPKLAWTSSSDWTEVTCPKCLLHQPIEKIE